MCVSVDGFGYLMAAWLIQAQPKVEKSVTYSPHPLKYKRLKRSPLLFSIFHTLMTMNMVHLTSSRSKERQKVPRCSMHSEFGTWLKDGSPILAASDIDKIYNKQP